MSVSPAAKKHGSLGRKIVIFILLINAGLSVVTASFQLYMGYQRDKDEVVSSIDVIEDSFRVGFENALWEYNYGLIEALMEGVFSRPNVVFVTLVASPEEQWIKGDPSMPDLIVHRLVFSHLNKDGQEAVQVGEMTIGLSLANVRARIWAQFWTLLLSNFVKTALASFIMLALFNALVSRHLTRIARYVRETSWLSRGESLQLKRKTEKHQDDLDHIVNAINSARENSIEAYRTLCEEVEQRRLAERLLADKANNLERANKEQAEFTYSLSHDLRSPINTIDMLLKELKLCYSSELVDVDEGKELIDLTQLTVKRMGKLVFDVLQYSQTIESELTWESVDLDQLFKEIFEDLQADIKASDAHIKLEPLPTIEGNHTQLRMLFQNLVANAIKFRAADKASIINVSSRHGPDSTHVYISVSDNGIGIDPQYHDKIFALFQRLHSHSTYAGSGIGLTLCQRVAINHQGEITVKSKPGEGSTFEVKLGVKHEQ